MEANNMKAMREALKKANDFLFEIFAMNMMEGHPIAKSTIDYGNEVKNAILSALAAPPRNCDVGTAEEQAARFNEYCRRTTICERCLDCMEEEHSIPFDRQCMMEWSQMPYEAMQEEGDE